MLFFARFVGATEHSFSPTSRPYNRTRVSLVSPGLRGNVPALRGDVHETSGEGTEVVLDRQKVSLRSTELRLEGTKDRLKATERRFAGPEIARASPDVFWHRANAALFSTGFASGRTNLRGVATKLLSIVSQRSDLTISCTNFLQVAQI